ncbi:MAG: PEP-CTERM sorting domain-containing protein [Steroidobacterales bacterium]
MNRSARMVLGAMVAAMGLAAGISGPAHAASVVVNGGFETGDFDGWTLSGNTDFFTGVECPGAPFALEDNCDAFFGPVGSDGTLAQDLPTLVGQFYNISFDFASDGGTPSDFSAFWGGMPLVSLTDPGAATQFLTFNALATAPTTTLSFNFRNDVGFLLLDSVSAAVPEPGTMALLGISLACLWMGRRRKTQ